MTKCQKNLTKHPQNKDLKVQYTFELTTDYQACGNIAQYLTGL